jgi:hypothetical protein
MPQLKLAKAVVSEAGASVYSASGLAADEFPYLDVSLRGAVGGAVAFVPLIIRWGPDASSDLLRRSARCSRCSTKGAALQHPSWAGMDLGWEPFRDPQRS